MAPDNKLQNLTRDIAFQYSGSSGVKKANLNALTFVEVFEALIERESRFDPNVISPKGAQGLGQLMPGTAADLGVSDPFDPESNLHASVKYFTNQLERFGNLELALAAYNAGPERVVEHKGIPPFAETKTYIAWILNKAEIEPLPVSEAAEPINSILPINASTKPTSPTKSDNPLEGDISVWEF
ncbi:MAG: lytic transglycosylase domain-containing protein [Salaquimonas sp.]